MVYRGKPSKACLPCRKRKLVCDLKTEGCSQCRRAKLVCHGYRDTEALRVTDESSAVSQKVQGKAAKQTAKSKASPPQPRPLAPPLIFSPADAIPRSVVISTCNQAKDLFYYNYVVGTLKPFDFLQEFIWPICKGKLLTASMDAVALAYLNYQRHVPNVQDDARKHYVKALRLLNNAVRDAGMAREDSTLLAILLLDLYEKITNKVPHYEGAWAAHLQGALTLVKLRGEKQYDDPVGLRILVRLTTNELISCVASHRPVPEEIVTLRNVISAKISAPADPKSRESDLMIKFARLRHEIEEGIIPDDEAVVALVDLDHKFLELSQDVWPTWQFGTIYVEEKSSHHWESYHHIYPCEQIGQMWNVLRLTRILLNEEILRRCLDVGNGRGSNSLAPSLRHGAIAIVTEMVSGICATVPQYIEDLSSFSFDESAAIPSISLVQPQRQFRPKQFQQTTSPNPTHHLPCYRLIFPLYVAAQSSAAPPLVRPWAVQQLRFMADYHAIENAARIADILGSGQIGDPWLVYAMLGSYAFVC